MKQDLLRIADLQVTVDDKVVLSQVDFGLKTGEVAVLLGENGSGRVGWRWHWWEILDTRF